MEWSWVSKLETLLLYPTGKNTTDTNNTEKLKQFSTSFEIFLSEKAKYIILICVISNRNIKPKIGFLFFYFYSFSLSEISYSYSFIIV